MRSKASAVCRAGWLLGVMAGFAIAPAAASGTTCPNELRREESRPNPATSGAPYSMGLPDCRAYEMVSPVYKATHDALPPATGLPVAPSGDTVGFTSEGAFGEPQNEEGGLEATNFYTAQRGASGWNTSSAFPPTTVLPAPPATGLGSDFSPDLRSVQVSCGTVFPGLTEGLPIRVRCALREAGGAWLETPSYLPIRAGVSIPLNGLERLGGSSDLSRVFFRPAFSLLEEDTSPSTLAGIYELAGIGTQSPVLRLVDVNNEGKVLLRNAGELKNTEALFGDFGAAPRVNGTTSHAVSENGERVFFTATPRESEAKSPEESEIDRIYARVHCTPGSALPCKEDGNGEWLETKNISAQSTLECDAECEASPPAPAVFEGASADGSKVFFRTAQELLSSDKNNAPELYEYDFNKPAGENLTLISGGKPGESVTGVVRASSDGSHVYFAATGVLTEVANSNGEKASSTGENLYGYDTNTGELKFVAASDWGGEQGGLGEKCGTTPECSSDETRPAQTTPDGSYVVFSTKGQLAGDLNKSAARAVYLYDFETGELTWISHGAAGFKVETEGEVGYEGEGRDALISPVPGRQNGGEADAGDWDRAISGCPQGISEEEREQCPVGMFDGEYVIFSTTEKLQSGDVSGALNVYEWHKGEVTMISDGHNTRSFASECGEAVGARDHCHESGMSASGSDIFFFTHTALVGQDSGVLGDVYDARADGGFPAPLGEPSCSSEQCQGSETPAPEFATSTSSLFPATGNPPPVTVSSVPTVESLAKPTTKSATRAQKLAKALKACNKEPRKRRPACRSRARKRYGRIAKPKKTAVKSKSGSGSR